jgi:hypothetical protein
MSADQGDVHPCIPAVGDGLARRTTFRAFVHVSSTFRRSLIFVEKYPNAMPAEGYPHECKIRIV